MKRPLSQILIDLRPSLLSKFKLKNSTYSIGLLPVDKVFDIVVMPIEYMINKTVIEHMNQPIKKKSVLHKLSTVSIAMALTTSLTAVASYDYGPYLQSGSDTRIAVSWRTKNATNSKVCYGTSQSLGNCIDEDNDTDDHTVTLDGLTPNTKYYYSTKLMK